MTETTWSEDMRERLARVVRLRGADRVADEIPAARSTVFRIVSGEIRRPTHAVAAGIERVVEAREQREAEWGRGRDRP